MYLATPASTLSLGRTGTTLKCQADIEEPPAERIAARELEAGLIELG